MKHLVSPKQAARAIGVSESSLKRWCDQGLLPTERTAGGHRRLPVSGVLTFLRSSGRNLVDPGVLGLPATSGQTERVRDRGGANLLDALIDGNDQKAWQVVLDLFLAGQKLAVLCDDVIAPALHEIGNRWGCGDIEVYQERRACELTLHLLHELRRVLPQSLPSSPYACGGTLDGDVYTISTTMIELILRDNGWRAVSLGNGLPFATLKAAIERDQPRLFWLSVSYIRDEDRFLEEVAEVYNACCSQRAVFAVGGQALTENLRRRMNFHAYCDTMQHLESFAATLWQRPDTESPVEESADAEPPTSESSD